LIDQHRLRCDEKACARNYERESEINVQPIIILVLPAKALNGGTAMKIQERIQPDHSEAKDYSTNRD
jgi:hypothetical protein